MKGKRLLIGFGIAAAILLIAGGFAAYLFKSANPRKTISSEGSRVIQENLSFHDKNMTVNGTVFRPSVYGADTVFPTVIVCSEDPESSRWWCRSLASKGFAAYNCVNEGEDMEQSLNKLNCILGGLRKNRYVREDSIYLFAEGMSCEPASRLTFRSPRKIKGLVLLSPGFNPLTINSRAKRYSGTILVVDKALGREENLSEVLDYIIR